MQIWCKCQTINFRTTVFFIKHILFLLNIILILILMHVVDIVINFKSVYWYTDRRVFCAHFKLFLLWYWYSYHTYRSFNHEKSIVVFVIYCQVSHLLDTCVLSSSKTKSGETKKETLGKPFLLFLMLQFPQVVRSYHVEDDTSSQN